MSVNPNCAPPQGRVIADQGEAKLNKDSFSPPSEKPESDILNDLQPDPEVRMFIDSSRVLYTCRYYFSLLMSLLSKLPKNKARPLYQSAAQIFGAFSKSCQQKANEIEQQ